MTDALARWLLEEHLSLDEEADPGVQVDCPICGGLVRYDSPQQAELEIRGLKTRRGKIEHERAAWRLYERLVCRGWAGEVKELIAALDDQRRKADESIIEASPLAHAVRDRVERNGEIEGTATEILELLSADKDSKVLNHPDWPRRAPTFGTKLREVAPNLRRLGIEVQSHRNGRSRTITIRRTEESPDLPSSPSPLSPAVQEAAREADGRGSVGPSDDSELPFCYGERVSDDTDVAAQEGSKSGQMTAMTAVPPESERDGQGPGFEVDVAEDEGVL